MFASVLLGIFGNTVYDLIKESLKGTSSDKDDDLIQRIYTALEGASGQFFLKYDNKFGEPNSSFLAREENIGIIIKSVFYGNNVELVQELCPKGFDGAQDASKEALCFSLNN